MWLLLAIAFLLVILYLRRVILDNQLLETVTRRNRGTPTERELVLTLLKHEIPAPTIFHDLYVRKPNGQFSQIDLVVATKSGMLVIEVKNYSGWIFGSGHTAEWTQVLAYGKRRYRLYNPILQNSKHVSDLKNLLPQFETVPFYSIVVFYGDCVLKKIREVPPATFVVKSTDVLEVIKKLMNHPEPARYTNKYEIVNFLKEAVINGEDKETQRQHILNVRRMLGKDN